MAAKLPSATSVLSAYSAFAASVMVVKAVLNEVQNITSQIIPQTLQEKIILKLNKVFQICCSSDEILTLIIEEHCNGLTKNQIYAASQTYLNTKINSSNNRLNVSKADETRTSRSPSIKEKRSLIPSRG